ncbi:6-phosphogluconolactonase [Bailinhaonella thermotolerans]|uniref:6-phosphogluconolactonase n=1 Tax=Bailinhaonella thermotolerans TaxID=1070861 RepID=A0A3A4AZK5_9ACTN|nr:6-phosphogluconolactonase [Bailinhaonella thermotolerans]RJL36122.1 6-phosphogluconolactonase [Bailinhaonella thermotolerans]
MSDPDVIVYRDGDELAKVTAMRLVARLAAAQAERGSASVVLTGGTIGIQTLAEVAKADNRDMVDWSLVDVWWGDERFLPAGDPERNETGARTALLDHVPVVPERVRVMAPSDAGKTAEQAAAEYALLLREAAEGGPGPDFDVLLLGLGPDCHVASLFPGLPGPREEALSVIAVHDSPKPPPTRISLTFPTIRAAREVWIVASGESKSAAVRDAFTGDDPARHPGAGARGRERTVFLLDEAAAGRLPTR